MKELHTPWLHWEGHHTTPGAEDLVERFEDLGRKQSGSTMEGITKDGNRKWNERRVQHARDALEREGGDLQAMLKPLFCDTELNLDNGGDFESTKITKFNVDIFVDPMFKSFGSVGSNLSDLYEAQILANGQAVFQRDQQLEREGEPVVDTIFRLAYIERSEADKDYVEKLIKAEIIDEAFAKDVLAIDFTRPVFSEARCQLVTHAPSFSDLDELNAANIAKGFAANIQASIDAGTATTAAVELLEHLKTEDDSDAHQEEVENFLKACNERESKELVEDVLAWISLGREKARERGVFEFQATMPFDELGLTWETHRLFRLSPKTCEWGDETQEPADEPPADDPAEGEGEDDGDAGA